jgi:hypothetical protein
MTIENAFKLHTYPEQIVLCHSVTIYRNLSTGSSKLTFSIFDALDATLLPSIETSVQDLVN